MYLRKLQSLALGLALASASILPATAQETWSMGSAKRAPDIGATFDQETVAALLGATDKVKDVEIQFIGNEQEMLQQVIRGRLNMGGTTPLALAGAFPDISVLNVPYLWDSQEQREYVYDKHVVPMLNKMFAGSGLVVLGVQEAGFNGVFCTFDCSDPASLSGKRIRVSVSASSRMFWDSLGSIAIQLPLPDTWSALEQGLVTAGELPIGYFATTPAAATAKHFVFTEHTHSPWIYFVNKRSWDQLDEADQKAVMAAMPATFSSSKRFFDDEANRAKSYTDMGGKIYQLDAAQREKWAALVKPNIPKLIDGMSAGARKIYDAIEAGKKEFAAR
ncbi:MAG TPA: TRAP transporter substrate-binding protein DctP [Rhizobiaceae bacterium]|nr:TRAP transporter substrate-binding protein DctP [Rhizobiaceae bacterium]